VLWLIPSFRRIIKRQIQNKNKSPKKGKEGGKIKIKRKNPSFD